MKKNKSQGAVIRITRSVPRSLRSQGAIELISILVFVFILIGLAMYVVGLYSLQVQQNSIFKERDDFAQSLIAEMELLQKVEEGYSREIEIPDYILEKYNVSIEGPFLVITDLLSGTNEEYYYELPGNESISLFLNDSDGNGQLEAQFIFEKEESNQFEGVELSLLANPCTGPDGVLITHGNSRDYFLNQYEITGGSCMQETRTCTNGILSGTYNHSSCEYPLPIVNFDYFSKDFLYGDNVTLSWNSTYALSCTASEDWSGSKNTSGNETQYTVLQDLNLTLDCSNSNGNTIVNLFAEVGAQVITIDSDQIEFNLFTYMGSPVEPRKLIVVIENGTYIYSNDNPSPVTPGFDTGTFANDSEIEIRNYGYIIGSTPPGATDKGGKQAWEGGTAMIINYPINLINYGEIIGGSGGPGVGQGDHGPQAGGDNRGVAGGSGGTAIIFNTDANITNNNIIYGSGGGGGSGSGGWRAGVGSGSGGHGSGGGYLNSIRYTPQGGGSGGCVSTCGPPAGAGGAGGSFGQVGSNGAGGYHPSGGSGGPGGYAFELNGNTIIYNSSINNTILTTNPSYTEGTWLSGTKGRIN